jgi:hypothetical protein
MAPETPTLTSKDLDSLPLSIQMIVVLMWCVICLHGGISPEPVEIGRLCHLKPEDVLHLQVHMQKVMQMFYEGADGLLHSERMDRERTRSGLISESRRKAAYAKHSKSVPALACAKPHANGDAKDHTKILHQKSEIRKRIESPHPENSDQLVERIAMLHPGLSHLKPTELPYAVTSAIVERCAEGETEQMLEGTAAFARHVSATAKDERKFITGLQSPARFWGEREYRKYLDKTAGAPEEPLTAIEKAKLQRIGEFDYDKKPAAEMRELLREREKAIPRQGVALAK